MSWNAKAHKRANIKHTQIDCQKAGDGRTEQAHKDEVDIHSIVKRAQRGEVITSLNKAQWGVDTMGQPGFDEAQNLLAHTKAMFEQLPSNIRKMCGNNPGNFVEFYEDERNKSYLDEAGLDTSHFPSSLEKAPETLPETPPSAE